MNEDRTISFAAPDITSQDIDVVRTVMQSGWITSGQEVVKFEADLASYLGADNVVALNSCTAALQTCLAYLDLPPGSIVAVPTWTFVSSALVILHTGHRPMLLDVDENTLNVDLSEIERAVEEGAAAVIGVHFAGQPLPARCREICSNAGVKFIEDAAHAFGAQDERGRVRGTETVGACFSFYATKNLTTGEGGAIATSDEGLAKFAREYRQHGMSAAAWSRYLPGGRATYDVSFPGIKANMPDTAAALGRSQLRRFDEMQRHRHTVLARYESRLSSEHLRMLSGVGSTHSAAHLAVALLHPRYDRDRFMADMTSQGVNCSVHFTPLHHLSWSSRGAIVPSGGLPVADRLSAQVVSLPLHAGISEDDADFVIECALRSLSRQ